MSFYQDTHMLSKRIFSTLGALEESTDSKTPITPKNDQDAPIVDLLVKKKKILETKAPGLFDYLARLSQDDVSTEVTSVGSELEPEESKPFLHIPIPRKASTNSECTFNLSKAIKLPVPEPEKKEVKTANETMEEEQQQKILQFLMQNTMMLNNAMMQHDFSKKLAMDCVEAMSGLRNFYNNEHNTHIERIEKIKEEKKNSSAYNSNPTGDVLFQHLFGAGKVYRYELILDSELPQPIFRERNISIKVKLVDTMTKEAVKHFNKVTLNLFLQTWEVPSTPIQRNKAGNKAIMGETEVEMKDGEAVFERIQINEVTSKFIHGHVAMVILPTKPLNHGTSLNDHCLTEGYVNFGDIKPLMLEKVVVKSKKKNNAKKAEK